MADCREFFRCLCYYSRNYFIADCNLHLSYWGDDEEFLSSNREILQKNGCATEEKLKQVLNIVRSEFQRRKGLDSESLTRRKLIKSQYIRLHEEIYVLKEEYLHPKFLDAVNCAKQPGKKISGVTNLQREKMEQVYRLPVFTVDFCKMLLEELENFEQSQMPTARPNTMNNGGLLLGEIGFDENFISPLRERYLNPLAKVLYPEWVVEGLDSHKAFTVKYKEGEDLDLGFHFDNAEVTLNVSLGKDFEDGSLYFGAMRLEPSRSNRTVEVKHTVGNGILHRGQHRHGAMPISLGERVNLIIWMRASSVRNKLCPMCDNKPRLSPASWFGDGFTKPKFEKEVSVCSVT